jgi:Single-strand binding protein family
MIERRWGIEVVKAREVRQGTRIECGPATEQGAASGEAAITNAPVNAGTYALAETGGPELRSLASGSSVAQFVVATNEFRGNGKERAEYHNVVVWI